MALAKGGAGGSATGVGHALSEPDQGNRRPSWLKTASVRRIYREPGPIIRETEMPAVCFFIFCFLNPAPSVPDGAGGFVPYNNSRVMPDGSLRPYNPYVDQLPAAGPYQYYGNDQYGYGPPPPPVSGYGLEYGPQSGIPPYMAPQR